MSLAATTLAAQSASAEATAVDQSSMKALTSPARTLMALEVLFEPPRSSVTVSWTLNMPICSNV